MGSVWAESPDGSILAVGLPMSDAKLQHEIDHLDGYAFVERVRDASGLFARKTYT